MGKRNPLSNSGVGYLLGGPIFELRVPDPALDEPGRTGRLPNGGVAFCFCLGFLLGNCLVVGVAQCGGFGGGAD
eukprot:scaffold27207_cov34-Isochrysis_galbana.AAC.1